MPHDLSRRGLVLGASACLAGGAGTIRSGFAAGRSTSKRPKVIVVGAGISGLAAARDLADSGFEVIVIEARDRLGGRLHTDRTLGTPVELGANWIHGIKDNPISALARSVNARMVVTDSDESVAVYRRGGRQVPDRELSQAELRLERLLARIDRGLDSHQDISLKAALEARDSTIFEDPLPAYVLAEGIEGDQGAPVDRVSAYWFDEDEAFEGPDVVLPGGYDAILAPLALGIDLRLSTPVKRIARTTSGVTVDTPDGLIAADFAICSVPLGVLKTGGIVFDPPLPSAHRAAIDRIGFGTATRAALTFSEAFWPEKLHFFGYVAAQRGRWPLILNHKPIAGRNLLTAIATGPYAELADAMSPAAVKADLLAALGEAFGRRIPEPTGFLASAWSRDPFAGGGYSVIAPGATPDDFTALSREIDGRLALAGEHTTFAHHATVHGAFLSGRRAARTILTLAGP